jgi:geranylgeranylglycerol-phosphate geranylgeranyltransferase
VVGTFLAGGGAGIESGTASAMAFFVCCGSYVLNDLYDVSTDRINKPWRPLAAGRITRETAARLVIVLWAVGGGLALLSGKVAGVFFSSWIVLLWLYSWRIKRHGWAGHVVVSMVASSGFMLGAAVGGAPSAGIIPLVVAFPFHLSREVAKGVADLRGDVSAGLATLAVRVGDRTAMAVLMWLICAVAAASLFPYVSGLYGGLYFLPVALVIYPILGICLWFALKARRRGMGAGTAAGAISRMFKAAMPVGLLAFFLAGV